MPIDASIPLQIIPPQFNDPMESYGKIMTIQKLAMEAKKDQMAIEGQQSLKDLYKSSTREDGTLDEGKLGQGLYGIDPKAGADFAKARADAAKTGAETRSKELEDAIKELDFRARLLGSAKDPQSYQQAYQIGMQKLGAKGMTGVPLEYDPNFVRNALDGTLTRKDQLEAENRAGRLDETKRSNRDASARGWAQVNKDKTPAAEQSVKRLMEGGMDRNTAIGIVDGRLVVSRDPISGQAQIIDKSNGLLSGASPQPAPGSPAPGGAVLPVAPSPIVAPSPEREAVSSIPQNTDHTLGTGGTGFYGNVVNRTADVFGSELPQQETETSLQSLKNLQVRTMTGLMATVPGKDSVQLMNALKELTVEPGSLFSGDSRAAVRLEQTRGMIAAEINRAKRDILANPGQFKPEQISATRASVSELGLLMADYDTILSSIKRSTEQQPVDAYGGDEERRYQEWKRKNK